MSIFDRIKGAIFGDRGSTQSSTKPAPTARQQTPAPPRTAATARPATPAAAPAPAAVVDIEAVLDQRNSSAAQKLNWRTSIVDLMKLVDLDPSLENRKELARELGYTGSTSDSATMNIWLHKQVMNKLAQNGGKVPASLRD
jgi:hypothetical protein